MILTSTSDYIKAVMGAAATTTNPDYYSTYADHTATDFTPGNKDGTLNGSTDVTLVDSPAASTQRVVKFFSINNRDTVPQTITIKYYNGSTDRVLFTGIVQAGDSLTYKSDGGFTVINRYGCPVAGGNILATPNYFASCTGLSGITGTRTITSTNSYAMWLGVANNLLSTVTLRYRVTTAAATITWAEAAVFKGEVNLGGNPTLTRLGYADISGVVNSTGAKATTITLSTLAQPGDTLWAVFGNQASTAMILRAGLADEIQSGTSAQITDRPSTVTSPTAWTIDSASDAQIWVRANSMP